MTQTYQSVHTTDHAVKVLGIADSTIRNCKRNHPDELQEHIHWGKGDDNKIWWTEFGLEKLSQLIPSAKAYAANIAPLETQVKRTALQRETEGVAAETGSVLELETPDSSCDDAVLDPLAMSLAAQRLKRFLDLKVNAEYNRLVAALGHLLQHPEQHPDPSIEQLLHMVGLSIASLRTANAFAAFNADAERLVSEARASLREG